MRNDFVTQMHRAKEAVSAFTSAANRKLTFSRRSDTLKYKITQKYGNPCFDKFPYIKPREKAKMPFPFKFTLKSKYAF